MAINDLLHEHELAVRRASAAKDEAATTDGERDNHFAKVAEYADRVRRMREDNAVKANLGPVTITITQPETIIYGTYTGALEQPSAAVAVNSWEGEGGALDPPQVVLPAGVICNDVRHYHVGPYVYQDLNLAVAEHMRQLSQQAADGAGDPPVDDYGAGDPPVDDPARD